MTTNIIIHINILLIAISTIGCKSFELREEGHFPPSYYKQRQQNKYYWRENLNPGTPYQHDWDSNRRHWRLVLDST